MAILRTVVSLYESLPAINQKRKNVNWKGQGDVPSGNPRAFFDGAAQLNSCGCGVHIIMDEGLHYLISWNGGKGSNCMAEAMALARLLTFCIFFDIHLVSIYGDSKIMVDHVLGKCRISCPHLTGWMDRVMFLWGKVNGCSIQHIYRSKNQQADCLSKEGLLTQKGIWSVKVISDGESFSIQDFSFPGF